MTRPKILSVQMVNGVKVTKIAPNQPKKPLTAALPARFSGNAYHGTYRAVKMH